jgi:hypothetical protein
MLTRSRTLKKNTMSSDQQSASSSSQQPVDLAAILRQMAADREADRKAAEDRAVAAAAELRAALDTSAAAAAKAAEDRAEKMATELRTAIDTAAADTRTALDAATESTKTELRDLVTSQAAQLEEKLTNQIRAEGEKIQTSLQRDLDQTKGRVDTVERGLDGAIQRIDQHQTQMAAHQTRMTAFQDQLAAVASEARSNHDQVRVICSQLSDRLTACQADMYRRTSADIDVTGSRAHTPVSVGASNFTGREGGRRAETKPTVYTGKDSWVDYRCQFEIISDLNEWGPEERARHLAASLGGPALSVLSTLRPDDRLRYVKLVDALSTRFDDTRCTELARVKLDSRVKNSNETLAHYASDIEMLVQRAYVGAGSESHELLCKERFLRGLNSPELIKQIKLARPVTFAAMLNIAIELSAVLCCDRESDRYARRPESHRVREVGVVDNSAESSDERSSNNANDQTRRGNYRQRNNNYRRGRRSSGDRGQASTGGATSVSQVSTPAASENSSVAELVSAVAQLKEQFAALSRGGNHRGNSSSQSRTRSSSEPRQRGVCWICGDPSHRRFACPERVGNENSARSQNALN